MTNKNPSAKTNDKSITAGVPNRIGIEVIDRGIEMVVRWDGMSLYRIAEDDPLGRDGEMKEG